MGNGGSAHSVEALNVEVTDDRTGKLVDEQVTPVAAAMRDDHGMPKGKRVRARIRGKSG